MSQIPSISDILNAPLGGANVTQLVRSSWGVVFDGQDFGLLDDVQPDIKHVTEQIMTGSTGKIVLGERFVGLGGSIKVQLRQLTRAMIAATLPWADASGPALTLTPPLNGDFYSYAAPLALHPLILPADDKSMDINFVRAAPVTAVNIKRTGKQDDVWDFEFNIFPHRPSLLASPPDAFWACLGPIPEKYLAEG